LKPATVFDSLKASGKIRGMKWRSSSSGFQQPMSGEDGRLPSHAAVCLAPERLQQLGIESNVPPDSQFLHGWTHFKVCFEARGDIRKFARGFST